MGQRREAGFTLVELMVVVLVIAVLLLIAIPTYFGARKRAQDRAAQSLARNALAAAKVIFQVDEDYTAATVTALSQAEPGLRFVPGDTSSSDPRVASVHAPDEDTFVVAVYSRTGTCWYVRDEAVPLTGGTTYASAPSDGTDCKASAPPGSFRAKW